MADPLLDRFVLASAGFTRRLDAVGSDQWTAPTPCAEWDVRALVNHMTRGNLNYTDLLAGGTRQQFLEMRDVDALGVEPRDAFVRSADLCARAFAVPGAFDRVLDYPLGPVSGRQALAVRTTDSTVHTWDLARAIGADDTLDAGLVAWIDDNADDIYAGLTESLARFFAPPPEEATAAASRQHRLLLRMGRS